MTWAILLSWVLFSLILNWRQKKKGLILCGGIKEGMLCREGFLLCEATQNMPWWLKVPVGIWSPLVRTLNAMMPTDSLYCCQLNGIMRAWKVFENELKIIFTSGWLLLPHVNRTLSEWPRFWDCINCSFNLDLQLLLFFEKTFCWTTLLYVLIFFSIYFPPFCHQ